MLQDFTVIIIVQYKFYLFIYENLNRRTVKIFLFYSRMFLIAKNELSLHCTI